MKHILLLGAGRSSFSLIRYLLSYSGKDDYSLTVADISSEAALQKTGGHERSAAVGLDIYDSEGRKEAIANADVVISLLPPALHGLAAEDCVREKIPLVTASYVSPSILSLHEEAVRNGVLILNECGLDPGIDHMSAMKIIHHLKEKGAVITSFKSYTGGLIAPECIDNPWGYKFTWNPRNVILAGQGTAKFIEDNKYRYLPYSRLFTKIEKIDIDDRIYDGYANRDSLSYRRHYGLEEIPTLLRGTLRESGFCHAWNAFVQIGLTDDSCIVENSEQLTYEQLLDAFLPASNKSGIKERVAEFMGWDIYSKEMQMLEYTGIFSVDKCELKNATAAQMLQHLLESKWKLLPGDKDMILMQHQFIYKLNNKEYRLNSTLSFKGKDQSDTAMAMTVGYPLGIIARMILKNQVSLTGVRLPLQVELYEPVLHQLEQSGIAFKEENFLLI